MRQLNYLVLCITDSVLQLKNLERNISKLPMKNMTDMMILNQTIEMVENNIQWINRSLETVKVWVNSYVHPTRSPETSTLPTDAVDANGDTDATNSNGDTDNENANGDTDAASANGDTDAANNNENTDDENSERLSDFERDSSSRGSCLAGDVNIIIILISFLCFQLKKT